MTPREAADVVERAGVHPLPNAAAAMRVLIAHARAVPAPPEGGDLAALTDAEVRQRYVTKWPLSVDAEDDVEHVLFARHFGVELVDADALRAHRCTPAPEVSDEVTQQ